MVMLFGGLGLRGDVLWGVIKCVLRKGIFVWRFSLILWLACGTKYFIWLCFFVVFC